MALWLMLCAEIAWEPTGVPGIRSSTWTPITGITAFVFGQDAFSGDFEVLPILGGFAIGLAVTVAYGILGAPLLVYTLGGDVDALWAAGIGFAYGIGLQVVVINLFANWVQAGSELYESLPQWGWWVGHALFGAWFGLLLARRLQRPR